MTQPKEWKLEDTAAFKAVRNPDLAIRSDGHQGWQQFLTWKHELLTAFDRGRQYALGHEVETYHGFVAEAHFRSWLSEFLPKKFGVTAGYIISQAAPDDAKTPAFDVIIYDQLESPVLWAEGHPDRSPQGKMRAIPAEYVKAVIEIKAALNTKLAKDAVDHLFELDPILGDDEPGAKYRYYLPPDFTCWTVFVELRRTDANTVTPLNHLARATALRGFLGGFVIRGEGLSQEMSGELATSGCNVNCRPLPSAATLLEGSCFSEWQPMPKGNMFGQVGLSWSKVYFSTWPFHLLRLLNGQYDTRSVPSWYCFPPVGNES